MKGKKPNPVPTMYQILCWCLSKYRLPEGLDPLTWDSLLLALLSAHPQVHRKKLGGAAALVESGVTQAQQDLSRKYFCGLEKGHRV